MYNKITIEDINKFNLNEDELKQIVNDITIKYAWELNTKITHDLLKEEIQENINQLTIQQRRENKLNQILNDETTLPNKRINLTIDITNNSKIDGSYWNFK
jgi:ethanolamine ammonia-lyase large subunit